MNKIIVAVVGVFMLAQANAQMGKSTMKKLGKANDHFMIQLTGDSWLGKPDSIKTKSIGKGANIYFMINFPFKTNKNFSVAAGAGFGTSGVFLDKESVDVSSTGSQIVFTNLNVANVNRFKKFKVATTYLEIPVELRYTLNPENVDKSFKFAIGAKVGTLLDAHTKAKTLQNSGGQTVNDYANKVKQKRFFNNSRIAITARVGWGHFSVFGQYQVTTLFKENLGPKINPMSIGIALSGL
jgi:Outer membrane protein beta-barrel domain